MFLRLGLGVTGGEPMPFILPHCDVPFFQESGALSIGAERGGCVEVWRLRRKDGPSHELLE